MLQLGEIFRPISAKPLNKDRNDVEVEQIEDNYLKFKLKAYNVPIQFCINIDEIWHTDFSDAVFKIVIVPYNSDKQMAHYPVTRTCKRASVITIDRYLFNYLPVDRFQIVSIDSGYVSSNSQILRTFLFYRLLLITYKK